MSKPTDGSPELSHLEEGEGGPRARMVDVGGKSAGARTALARAVVRFPDGVLQRVLDGQGPKGPIEEVARVAGILAAKRTAELIPMCHPLGLDHVEVLFRRGTGGEADQLEVRCRARCQGRTGVEMEALTGASVAALTVYDMTKALAKGTTIERVELLEKTGGRSGTWRGPSYETGDDLDDEIGAGPAESPRD
jgi:cyclic pyranopterin phosphate synthase